VVILIIVLLMGCIWHDREIVPAADWEGEINREIQV